jgi:hypothetical protein
MLYNSQILGTEDLHMWQSNYESCKITHLHVIPAVAKSLHTRIEFTSRLLSLHLCIPPSIDRHPWILYRSHCLKVENRAIRETPGREQTLQADCKSQKYGNSQTTVDP